MNPQNRQFLDEQFHHFLVLERAFYLRGLMVSIRDQMAKVMREEFNPGFTTCMSCDTDIANMVRTLYRNYHDWLRKQTNDNTQYKDVTEGIIEMGKKLNNPPPLEITEVIEMKQDPGPPLIVAANFPLQKRSHKKKQ